MERILHPSWQLQLTLALVRGKFFYEPTQAMAMGGTVAAIINRDWDGMVSNVISTGADQPFREKFPISASFGDNDHFIPNFDDAPKGSTAIIPLKGSMLKYGTLCSYGTEEVAAAIYHATAHDNISAIVLDIDSGGGAVDAVAPIVQAIRTAQAAGLPVVAKVDMACSAAYWAASACDTIIADNEISATIGSIGVMMSFWDVKGYYEQKGYKLHTVYAPQSDHKNAAFEKALKGDYDQLQQEELEPLAINFQNAVKENRAGKLDLTAVGLLNGKAYYAHGAHRVGLIDEIGTRETAFRRAQELVLRNEFLKS